MKVTATIASAGKGLKSACAVNIVSDRFKHVRVIPFAKATVNQAELFALGYVLTSIKQDLDVQFEVTTFNPYVGRILERDAHGQFVVTPEKNIEQVKEVRNLVGKRTVNVIIAKTADVTTLRDMIKKVVEPANA